MRLWRKEIQSGEKKDITKAGERKSWSDSCPANTDRSQSKSEDTKKWGKNGWAPKIHSSVRVWGFSRLHEKRLNKQTNKQKNAGDAGSIPGLGRFPEEKWQPTLVFLPEESHGQRSLVGYSPGVAKSWTQLCPHAHKHTDTTDNTNKNLV